jgi:predicted phage-related endonuclease
VSPLTSSQARARANAVGASEVGALVGFHPYASPASIYARIVLGQSRKVGSAADLGRELEPAILALAAKRLGVRIRTSSWTYRHPSLPLVATTDAVGLDPYGERSDAIVLEAKLVGSWAESDWSNGPPTWIVDQVQAQLLLSRRRLGVVAALVGGTRFQLYELPADQARQAELQDAVRAFARDHLEPQVPPPLELPRDADLVLQLVPAPAGVAFASGELLDLGDALDQAARARLDAQAAEDAVRAQLELALAPAPPERLTPPPGHPSRWTAQLVTRDDRRSLRFLPSRSKTLETPTNG